MRPEIKTAIILAVIVVVIVTGLNTVFSTLEKATNPTESETQKIGTSSANLDKSNYKKAPDLVGIAHYINTTPEELAKNMEGKVVLYDFWTYSCINCVRTLPHITAWNAKYADDGLLIIGIHSPEFEFEKEPTNVEMAVSKYGISYPVVLDNDMKTWNAFENRYWPRKYIADDEGYIRYDHIGEGEYEQTEKVIQELLKERAEHLGLKVAAAKPLVELKEFEQTSFRTPELYFGYSFVTGRNQLGNIEGFKPETNVKYTIPEDLQLHYYYLDGTWKNLKGSMKLVSEEGRIKIPFFAKEVNIVAANNAVLDILLDGKPITSEYAGTDIVSGRVQTHDAELYNIIKTKEASSHTLEIIVTNPGFEVYTLTFG